MIKLEELVKNILLPTFPEDMNFEDNVKIGSFDPTVEKLIAIRDHERQMVHNVYTASRSLYDTKHIRIIVRWNQDYSETEYVANSIYEKIKNIREQQSDNFKVLFFTMDNEQSMLNRRSEDILERIIDCYVYYQE